MSPAERLRNLREDRNPALVARVSSGFVVMGAYQFFLGYCLLLADPLVGKLNDLEGDARARFLSDMAGLGDAVIAATKCVRANYSIYGNLDPFLHAHVWPRYGHEDERYRTSPPFAIPPEIRESPQHAYDPGAHGELQKRIRDQLLTLGLARD